MTPDVLPMPSVQTPARTDTAADDSLRNRQSVSAPPGGVKLLKTRQRGNNSQHGPERQRLTIDGFIVLPRDLPVARSW